MTEGEVCGGGVAGVGMGWDGNGVWGGSRGTPVGYGVTGKGVGGLGRCSCKKGRGWRRGRGWEGEGWGLLVGMVSGSGGWR